jgi:hypothetical protein
MGCSVVYFGENPTFRSNTPPPYLGLRNSLLPGGTLEPEDGSGMSLQNVGLAPNYMITPPPQNSNPRCYSLVNLKTNVEHREF